MNIIYNHKNLLPKTSKCTFKLMQNNKLQAFFDSLSNLDNEQIMELVDQNISSDTIEIFVNHIENFYGIEDDEELGMLAQLVVTGYLAHKLTTQEIH